MSFTPLRFSTVGAREMVEHDRQKLIEQEAREYAEAGKEPEPCRVSSHFATAVVYQMEHLIWTETYEKRRAKLARDKEDVTATVDPALLAAVKAALKGAPQIVAEVKAGKEKALGSLIGPILKQVKADPRAVKELLAQEVQNI